MTIKSYARFDANVFDWLEYVINANERRSHKAEAILSFFECVDDRTVLEDSILFLVGRLDEAYDNIDHLNDEITHLSEVAG